MKLILKHKDFQKNKIILEVDKEKNCILKYNDERVKNNNGRSTVKDDNGNKRKIFVDFKNIDIFYYLSYDSYYYSFNCIFFKN